MSEHNVVKYIVVVLHGFGYNPERYKSVEKVIEHCYPDATVMIPSLALTTFSLTDPNAIVIEVLNILDTEWEKEIALRNGISDNIKIIIIGHSTGALLARKLYVVACGENKDAAFEKIYNHQDNTKTWAQNVDRIILFAGMNRGWSVNHHLYTKTAFLIRTGIIIGYLFRLLGFEPLAFKTRKGASFITQLRIQWLSMLKHSSYKKVGNALTIQLLGTKDDIISPDDNIDMVTGSSFLYLEMPFSGHVDVIDMDDVHYGNGRRKVFETALTKALKELSDLDITTSDQATIKVDENVTDVVFVMHGIRDTGYWTQKLARRVKVLGEKAGRRFATETSTYGYFPMLPFLVSFVRREKVEWLMDRYTENLALYPNAELSYMGHSNGTYLLAKALKEYPACKFKNVVFAGSVVHSKFNWREMIKQKRITKFYNFIASSDWVVATFPKTFQTLHIQDLGSGGFDGFTQLNNSFQLRFIEGSHGAATEEKYWDEIANFIVEGDFSEPVGKFSINKRPSAIAMLGAAAPLPFILIVALLFVFGWLIVHFTPAIDFKILFLFIYLFFIWKIVTKI